MLGRDYPQENCSIARALEVFGDRWSMLILRDALFRDVRRYSDFHQSLGIASNVLSDRLARFVAKGVFDLDATGAYAPTAKARAAIPALVALTAWGDAWAAPHGAPIIYRTPDGNELHVELRDDRGRQHNADTPIMAIPGPGVRARARSGKRS